MSFNKQLRWTLFPDLHSEYDRFARGVEYHWDSTDMFGILGDVVDGPWPRKTISLIRSLGAKVVTIAGNHEWVLRNVLSVDDTEAAEVWAEEIWPRYQKGMLKDYDLHKIPLREGWVKRAELLRERMLEDGTLQWLDEMLPYIQTPSFIGVHAGPRLDVSWTKQAAQLDLESSRSQRLYNQPDQLFDKTLGRITAVPPEVDSRLFITGHMHNDFDINARRRIGRVGLASQLCEGAPLYTWTSEDDVIHEHLA